MGILIEPSRVVFHPACCVQSIERLRPATLIDALDAPIRRTIDGCNVYVAETSRRRRNDPRYVPGASASMARYTVRSGSLLMTPSVEPWLWSARTSVSDW